MPSVLISSDRDIVTSALESKPKFTDPQVTALYNWCFRLLTALLNYVTYFICDNFDRILSLQNSIDDLTQQVEELRNHASQPAPDPLPANRPVPTAVSHSGRRCQRCNAVGHDTTQRDTKDRATTKKRDATKQKHKNE